MPAPLDLRFLKERFVTTSRSALEAEIVQLLAQALEMDPAAVQLDAGLADVGINSLQLVEVVFTLEEHYGIAIPYNANDPGIGSVAALLDKVIDLIEAKAAQCAPA